MYAADFDFHPVGFDCGEWVSAVESGLVIERCGNIEVLLNTAGDFYTERSAFKCSVGLLRLDWVVCGNVYFRELGL